MSLGPRLLPAAVGFCLTGILLCAQARVTERLRYADYPVTAAPGMTLLARLNAASPIRDGPRTYFGRTNWNVQWRLSWAADASGICRVTSHETDLDVQIILPRLDRADQPEASEFARFVSALRSHELGHYQIAQVAAQEIDSTLAHLAPARDCASLEAMANRLAQAVLAKYNALNEDYDRRTGHGRTQGAWLGED